VSSILTASSLKIFYFHVPRSLCIFTALELSLCITTYNRPELTIKAFEKVYNDPRITEIIIVDDASHYGYFVPLAEAVIKMDVLKKVRLIHNGTNLGMHLNKRKAIECSTNYWCLLFDSDNVLDVDYLDALELDSDKLPLDPTFIFCPNQAIPRFDYRGYTGAVVDKSNAHKYLHEKNFQCLLNTCNYVVHRETYLKNFVKNENIGAADTIWHTYNHLKAGGALYVVPGMSYQHLVHEQSGWRLDRAHSLVMFNEVIDLIAKL
jgi:glycosyltransferase involved in cell wall biosynthesis